MLKDLTTDQIELIKQGAALSCIRKGISKTIPDPSVPGAFISNPAYNRCYMAAYNEAMMYHAQDRIGEWFDKTKSQVQDQDGITGLLAKLITVSNASQTSRYAGSEKKNVDPGYNFDQIGSGSNVKPSNTWIWIALTVLLLLIITFVVIVIKNRKAVKE